MITLSLVNDNHHTAVPKDLNRFFASIELFLINTPGHITHINTVCYCLFVNICALR